jgi:hypothetical protein
MKKIFQWFLILMLIIAVTDAVTVSAQEAEEVTSRQSPAFEGSLGFRVGLSMGPEQMVFGAHTIIINFSSRIRFVPSFDVGFGDDRTVFNAYPDFRFEIVDNQAYIGGAPTFVIDKPKLERDEDRPDEIRVGAAVLAGIYLPIGEKRKYNFEARYELETVPDFKVTIGYLF